MAACRPRRGRHDGSPPARPPGPPSAPHLPARLADLLDRPGPCLGSWAQLDTPEGVELLAGCGFDFAMVDTEHTAFGIARAQDLLRAADAAGLPTAIRVAEANRALVTKALDCGFGAVVVPGIRRPDEVATLLRWTRFADAGAEGPGADPRAAGPEAARPGAGGAGPGGPGAGGMGAAGTGAGRPEAAGAGDGWGGGWGGGARGACPCIRAAGQSTPDWDAWARGPAADVLALPMIETPEAVEAIEAILSQPGLRAVVLGPFDLSVEMGLRGDTTAPAVQAALARVVAACAAAQVTPILPVFGQSAGAIRDTVAHWRAAGVRHFTLGTDKQILAMAARSLAAAVHGQDPRPR